MYDFFLSKKHKFKNYFIIFPEGVSGRNETAKINIDLSVFLFHFALNIKQMIGYAATLNLIV